MKFLGQIFDHTTSRFDVQEEISLRYLTFYVMSLVHLWTVVLMFMMLPLRVIVL
jgi:hypothetical protein